MDRVVALDHVQVAIPAGEEGAARGFWVGLLGFAEETKPPALAGRGGAWFRSGSVIVHVGVDPVFVPAAKAHPAFTVRDLDALVVDLEAAGHPVRWDHELADVRRLHVNDPFGNRVELIQA